ncbi:universal stress protein [Natronomonas gomsonensis]|jgi:nucleotide-binding universal stress UspA family protein|uniref:universal stress protein n=1 Tax=Natronomonas gomsonensis TaxID=1046043 RepID=UPI0020CA4B4A|nr:universal stress protein [Natronomonas gomsonensis]MCY4730739.1 universal stress protein [Natronomonas gomsonensis]
MSLEVLTLAVGPDEDTRIKEMASLVCDIAGATGATVLLLHVFSQSAYDEGVAEAGYDPDDPPPAHTLASRLENIDRLSFAFEEADIEYRIRGEIGDVTDRIVSVAKETNTDMLFVGGRKRSPTGKAVFGSTSHRVLMNAPCPVTFVRQDVTDAE